MFCSLLTVKRDFFFSTRYQSEGEVQSHSFMWNGVLFHLGFYDIVEKYWSIHFEDSQTYKTCIRKWKFYSIHLFLDFICVKKQANVKYLDARKIFMGKKMNLNKIVFFFIKKNTSMFPVFRWNQYAGSIIKTFWLVLNYTMNDNNEWWTAGDRPRDCWTRAPSSHNYYIDHHRYMRFILHPPFILKNFRNENDYHIRKILLLSYACVLSMLSRESIDNSAVEGMCVVNAVIDNTQAINRTTTSP